MNNRTANKETCLLCAFWHPEGKIRKIVRHGGDCKLTGKDTRIDETCWGWKICSLKQIKERKDYGLIWEVR